MQAHAARLALSETAYLKPQEKKNHYDLRWFTSTTEVDLCGHATLAAAHFLREGGVVDGREDISFFTRSGTLTAHFKNGMIALDFPQDTPVKYAEGQSVLSALRVSEGYVWRGKADCMVVLGTENQVRSLQPDMETIKSLPFRGVIVTGISNRGEFDFIARFFAPGAGIPEDPVTGSAYCVLAPYWSHELNKCELKAFQASERGGTVCLVVGNSRVAIAGHAISIERINIV